MSLKDSQLRLLKDPMLIFVVIVVSLASGMCALHKADHNYKVYAVVAFFLLGAVGLAIIYYLKRPWLELEETKQERDDLARKAKEREEEVSALHAQIADPPISIITQQDYASLLASWGESDGEGQILLYNIELQSFQNNDTIEDTWGGLKDLENVKEIILLLPYGKVRRWEQVVCQQEHAFFADKRNRKFTVCEFEGKGPVGEGPAPTGIAFAMYRYLSGPHKGQLHPKVVWFVLSRPFSNLQEPFVEEDGKWWDYCDILLVNGRAALMAKAMAYWNDLFSPTRARSVERVLIGTKPLEAIPPEQFLSALSLPGHICAQRLAYLQPRGRGRPQPLVIDAALGANSSNPPQFTITYENGDTINGHYVSGREPAVPGEQKPGLVWIGGFTEQRFTRLPELFEKVLRKEDVVQFHYQVSSPIADTTLTRYAEDLAEVLRYANGQTQAIIPDKLVVVARSINAFIAAQVCAMEAFLGKLGGVILVAPVFDVIEMMDNYRRLRGQRSVTVERGWRRAPGFDNGMAWEDTGNGWLEYFGNDLHLTLLADIVRQDPGTYRADAFKRNIGKISEVCPVYVLSNKDDPITGSADALAVLEKASSGTGLIRSSNYEAVEIPSKHLTIDEIDKDAYPYRASFGREAQQVREVLRTLLNRVGLPVVEAEGAE